MYPPPRHLVVKHLFQSKTEAHCLVSWSLLGFINKNKIKSITVGWNSFVLLPSTMIRTGLLAKGSGAPVLYLSALSYFFKLR